MRFTGANIFVSFSCYLSFDQSDGPNCSNKTYRHTIVFSKLIVWKGIVYRFTIIVYSRASISAWIKRNRKARILRQVLRDNAIETNGYIRYEDFSLKQNMEYIGREMPFNGRNGRKTGVFWIQPNKNQLTDNYFKRNPNSVWKRIHRNNELSKIRWTHINITKRGLHQVEAVVLPEFQNRFGYVSVYASAINKITSEKQLSENQLSELVYAALQCRSNLQFHWVLEEMKQQWETSDQTLVLHPFLFYKKICTEYDLNFCGGINPRYTSTGTAAIVKTLDELIVEMEKFETTVNRLNSGELLKRDGKWKCHDLKGVGAVCGISFPSLCCFVGLGKTPYAVQMAKQSPVNTKPGSYFGKLRTKLEITADDGNPSDQSQFYFSLWKAVGKSIGENVATIENAVCGLLRATKRTETIDDFTQW